MEANRKTPEWTLCDDDTVLTKGNTILARWKADGKFYRGKIRVVGQDGTCDVAFDDGDERKGVPLAQLKIQKIASGPPCGTENCPVCPRVKLFFESAVSFVVLFLFFCAALKLFWFV